MKYLIKLLNPEDSQFEKLLCKIYKKSDAIKEARRLSTSPDIITRINLSRENEYEIHVFEADWKGKEHCIWIGSYIFQ